MAKKLSKTPKKRAPKTVDMPPLNAHAPTELTGSCKCEERHTVRIPHHARVEHQMITSFCKTCQTTFYLTGRTS